MFAIIETGGKQYKVLPNTTIMVEKLPKNAGDEFKFDRVLLIADDSEVSVGAPYLKGAAVHAKVVQQLKGEKKVIFRYHSKTRYRKHKGHRQQYTEVKVERIER